MMKKLFRKLDIVIQTLLIVFTLTVFIWLLIIKKDVAFFAFAFIGLYQQISFIILCFAKSKGNNRIIYFLLLIAVYGAPILYVPLVDYKLSLAPILEFLYNAYCFFVMIYYYVICIQEYNNFKTNKNSQTLKNKIIIYDDACPLCQTYTDAFIKYGLLSKDGRKPFSEIDASLIALLDLDRACNEIPLIDTETQEVVYGIDAMVEVLNYTFPFVKPIASIAPINWVLRKLYKMISYNRKGIVAKIPSIGKFNCAPSYSFNYKKIFIALCFTVATIIMYYMFRSTFPKTIEAVMATSGLMVLCSIFIQNKNYLEFIMQWQLQLMIMCIVLIPAALLGQVNTLGALVVACITCILFVKQIYQRVIYLQYYFGVDK